MYYAETWLLQWDDMVRCLQQPSVSSTVKNWDIFLFSTSNPNRITESTSSCGSVGTTPGWSFRRILNPIPWLLILGCSSVSGNLTCSLPMKKAPTFTTWPRTTSFFSYFVTVTFSSAWGNDYKNKKEKKKCLINFNNSISSKKSLYCTSFSRLSITLSCPLDLTLFPMDTQRCKMQLESCELNY